MLKSLALVSVLASTAFAQTSNSTSSSASSLIPSGISTTCSNFLTSLNADTNVTSCLSTLTAATAAFTPGSNITGSSASVTTALSNLCSTSAANACPETLMRSKLVDFQTNCNAELTTSLVEEVMTIYNVLYVLAPLRTSACSQADDGSYCIVQPTTTTRDMSEEVSGQPSLGLADLLSLLYIDNSALKRRADVSALEPNMTTFHDTNLIFLFFNSSLDATTLCTTCARNVLTAYMNFESNLPFVAGLSASQLLDTQSALYSAVNSKCPAGFLTGAVQAAGGLSTGGKSGALPVVSLSYGTIFGLAMGIVSLALSSQF